MRQDQKFTPKYWVVHNTKKDNVLLWTARRDSMSAVELYEDVTGKDFLEQEDLAVDLFEVNFVENS